MKRVTPKQPPMKLGTNAYEKLRFEVLMRDGWRCQNCGSLQNLQVHHQVFRSHSGDDCEFNLITLCVTCHKQEHC